MIIDKIVVPREKFIVAVSGGLDSLCLTMLASEAAKLVSVDMMAVFVNHNLRSESSAEILPVLDFFKKNDIESHVLSWKHGGIQGNLEKKAREARYNLLTSFCHEINAESILMAHHSLDQWETFFMRLSKGSGLRGLCSMRNISEYNGINIERPLLQYTKDDLEQTLKEKFEIIDYVNDPMNFESKYERVRWRRVYKNLSEKHGLSAQNVAKSISRLQRSENCLDCMAEVCMKSAFDGIYIDMMLFTTFHIEIQTRIILKIIEIVAEKKGMIVSYSLLERVAKIIIRQDFSAINIGGCVFRRDKTKNVKVSIESRKAK